MKQPLFFHIRPDEPTKAKSGKSKYPTLPHTYAVKQVGDTLVVGYAITHVNDQYCKAEGRKRAQKKMIALETIKDEHFRKDSDYEVMLPLTIAATVEDIVQRSGELLNLVGEVKVKMFATQNRRRVPFMDVQEIKPVTATQVSQDVFGGF